MTELSELVRGTKIVGDMPVDIEENNLFSPQDVS
jgi:hypothetical protein